jgi:hypothetical protein
MAVPPGKSLLIAGEISRVMAGNVPRDSSAWTWDRLRYLASTSAVSRAATRGAQLRGKLVRKEEKNMSMRRKESSERETRYRSMVIGHQRRGLDMAALAISTSRVPELRNARLANDEPLVLEDDSS